MKPHVSYRTLTAICLVCLWAIIGISLNGFIPVVTAQEGTTDSSALPTPTSAPTWTPTVTNTPNPHATSTAAGTPAPTGRVVDFRVDDDDISAGDCVLFSWLVRGDINKVEFDQHDDGKDRVLVPEEKYDQEECPDEDTDYTLVVSWLDGTQTKKTIDIDVSASSDGDGDESEADQTAAPGTPGAFVPVTPLPMSGVPGAGGGQAVTPQAVAYQTASGGVVVTPDGALSSVVLLPETGYGPPPAEGELQAPDGPGLAHPGWMLWLSFAAESGVFLGGLVAIGLILSKKLTHQKTEVRR